MKQTRRIKTSELSLSLSLTSHFPLSIQRCESEKWEGVEDMDVLTQPVLTDQNFSHTRGCEIAVWSGLKHGPKDALLICTVPREWT